MYTKDKSIRITLRLNDEQFAFVKDTADTLGVSPSDFLRMVINSSMSVTKRTKVEYDPAAHSITTKTTISTDEEGAERRENEQGNINDQL